MSEQCCPQCGSFVSVTEVFCPFCRKVLSPSVHETPPPSSVIDPNLIRRKQNIVLWLFLIAIVWGAFNIAVALTALKIAQEEIPEATIRDVRFNRIEIQTKNYQTLRTILTVSKLLGNFLTIYCFFIWCQYLRAMSYSRWGTLGIFFVMFIPLVNLIVFFVMLHKGRTLIAKYSR